MMNGSWAKCTGTITDRCCLRLDPKVAKGKSTRLSQEIPCRVRAATKVSLMPSNGDLERMRKVSLL